MPRARFAGRCRRATSHSRPRGGTGKRSDGEREIKMVAPRAGFEPATIRLTVECSTAELPGKTRSLSRAAAYNKAIPAWKVGNAECFILASRRSKTHEKARMCTFFIDCRVLAAIFADRCCWSPQLFRRAFDVLRREVCDADIGFRQNRNEVIHAQRAHRALAAD